MRRGADHAGRGTQPSASHPGLTSPAGVAPGLRRSGLSPSEVPIGVRRPDWTRVPTAPTRSSVTRRHWAALRRSASGGGGGGSGGGGLVNDLMQAANQLGAGQAIDLLKGLVMPAIMQGVQRTRWWCAGAALPAAACAAGAAKALPGVAGALPGARRLPGARPLPGAAGALPGAAGALPGAAGALPAAAGALPAAGGCDRRLTCRRAGFASPSPLEPGGTCPLTAPQSPWAGRCNPPGN